MDRWTIGSLLETASGYLREKGSASPRLDAELLLAETLGLERIHLYTEYDRPLAACEIDRYRELIGRRGRHEPVAYILGHAYFRHLRLEVTPAVLIPRPETEELVELALHTLRLKPVWEAPPAAAPAPLIADVGTGSGAIALSLAQETGLRVVGVDASAEALGVAARNRARLALESQVELREGDLLAGVAGHSLRMVISNPPYVNSSDWEGLPPDIRMFEPIAALDGGPDGLDVYRRLLPEAAQVLRAGGTVLLEVGDGQASSVEALATAAGFCLVTSHKDLSRKDRMVSGTLPGAATANLGDLDGRQLDVLAKALGKGAVVGVPTDTVYGLAARWDSNAGVQRLLAAKRRGADRPVAVVFASTEAIRDALPDLDLPSMKVLAALLPGPFTFVVETAVPRPQGVGAGDSLGVRVPEYPALLDLLAGLGVALAATSANLTGGPDPVALADVDGTVLAHCALALAPPGTGGAEEASAPDRPADRAAGGAGRASTVIDLRPLAIGGEPIILREGAVPGAEVLAQIAALF